MLETLLEDFVKFHFLRNLFCETELLIIKIYLICYSGSISEHLSHVDANHMSFWILRMEFISFARMLLLHDSDHQQILGGKICHWRISIA